MSQNNKNKTTPVPPPAKPAPNAPQRPATDAASGVRPIDLARKLETWLSARRLGVLIFFAAALIGFRVSLFNSVAEGPLYHMYKWNQSDNAFFDEWSRSIAAGDWLNRNSPHPYHIWHDNFAQFYFEKHPEKRQAILDANPGRDSTFNPGTVLWNEWYNGPVFHQEPMYAYTLALFYKTLGNGPYWMMALQCLLGVLTGLMLWQIARRYFDETTAFLTGLLYLFSGVVLFFDVVILRTAWLVFFAVLTIWTAGRALDSRSSRDFLIAGASIGFAWLMQSTFTLYLFGFLGIYFLAERKQPLVFLKNAGLTTAAFAVMLLPVVYRNAQVGAPLTSVSSVGAVTFLAANVFGTQTTGSWYPEASKCAEIMGQTGGKFGPVIKAALGTFPSAGEYFNLWWQKLEDATWGMEATSNENFYFYKQLVPILKIAFVNFYWIFPLGLAGLVFAVWNRKKPYLFYLTILMQFAILTGFYVVGRFRTPLVVVLTPFAAYAMVELLRIGYANWRQYALKAALVAVCVYFLSYKRSFYEMVMLRSLDYHQLYENAYLPQIQTYGEAKDWDKAVALHNEFLKAFQPPYVRDIQPSSILSYQSNIDILKFFATHHKINGTFLEVGGYSELAKKMMDRNALMMSVVERSKQRLEERDKK
jgi:4-amino-4-deoxy-L-arabinose transferase-like glycosyltransferase